MRSLFTILVAGSFFLSGGCASQPGEDNQVASNDDEVVCKTEQQLGSTFKRRTCKTIAEWREEREAAKELALTRRPEFNHPGPVGGSGPD